MGRTPVRWELADLAGITELAEALGVGRSAVSNWIVRYPDFPAPLVTLASGPVYSLRQVRAWHDERTWKPGKHTQRP